MKWLDVLLRRRPEPERERAAERIKHLQTDSDRVLQRAASMTRSPDELLNHRLEQLRRDVLR